MTLYGAFALDIVVLVCCVLLLRKIPLSFSHPATPYLVFHILSVPLRLLSLMAGVPPLFALESWGPGYYEVSSDELVRATAYADLALVAMTVGWLLAARRRPAPATSPVIGTRAASTLAVILLFAGALGMVSFAVWPQAGDSIASSESPWRQSTWLTMTVGWPGLGLILLAYARGVGSAIVIPFLAYLGLMGLQGFNRFRVVVPALMVTMIYLDQRRRRWPPLGVTLGFLALATLFVPMKQIGRSMQGGVLGRDILTDSLDAVKKALAGDSEFQFLDMLAATVTLTEQRGSYFLGRTYSGVLTLAVPRPWWPDKPGLADYMFDLSTPQRPMAQAGMVVTFIGESYTNFGLVGVVALPLGLAYLLGLWYRRAYAAGYGTRTHFAYVLVACSLIQVYRDGLTSFVIFVAVYSMPLVALALISGRLRTPALHGPPRVLPIVSQGPGPPSR
jgi:hypothetical protein